MERKTKMKNKISKTLTGYKVEVNKTTTYYVETMAQVLEVLN